MEEDIESFWGFVALFAESKTRKALLQQFGTSPDARLKTSLEPACLAALLAPKASPIDPLRVKRVASALGEGGLDAVRADDRQGPLFVFAPGSEPLQALVTRVLGFDDGLATCVRAAWLLLVAEATLARYRRTDDAEGIEGLAELVLYRERVGALRLDVAGDDEARDTGFDPLEADDDEQVDDEEHGSLFDARDGFGGDNDG